jgi:RimJ/RimL family protein N-acetyltransferase
MWHTTDRYNSAEGAGADRSWGEHDVVETDRLRVRPFRPGDADALYAYLSRAEVYRFEPGAPIDRAEARLIVEERSTGTSFLALELRSEGRMIGHLSWHLVEPAHLRTWELGFIVDPRFQRRGFASEGTRAWIEHAIATGAVHRVVAHCHPDNVASWRTLERVGFAREGHLRHNLFFRTDDAGEPIWQDTLVYALLNPLES